MSSSIDSIKSRINKLSEEYYTTNNKHNIFKSNQKKDCAKFISTNVSINSLIHNTAYIIRETNKIYFDYTIFKTYATPELFNQIVDHVKNLNIQAIEKHGSFEIHVNWATYTVSAHERYKNIFQMFSIAHSNHEYDFSSLISNIYIYNTPSIINMVTAFIKPFIEPIVLEKLIIYDKQESNRLLNTLLS